MKKIFIILTLLLTVSLFAEIRTPDYGNAPYINSPEVVGVSVNNNLFFKIASSGAKPIEYSITNLPKNFSLDSNTGIITGKSSKKENIKTTITVKNKFGSFSKPLTIMVGEKFCLTPPLAWNSWYCFNEAITQDDIMVIASGMVKSGLIDYGYSYVNIDDCWQGKRDLKTLAITTNEKFPNMKTLVSNLHALGLKAGIYSTPWICSYAGFRGGSGETEDGKYLDILPIEERLQPNQIYGTYPGVHNKKKDKVGKYWFFDRDAKQFAAWGFDFIKVDWNPNDVETTKKIYDDLKNSGRDIVLSLSNATPFENVDSLKKYASLWRTTGDIRDSWNSISGIAKAQEKWFSKSSSGAFNDPDMLQVGSFGGASNYEENFRKTKLTEEEQYFQYSFWAIMQAPLIISCDVNNLDNWTSKLLMNRKMIEINQTYPVVTPTIKKIGNITLLSRVEEDKIVCGIFNYGNTRTVKIDLEKIYGKQISKALDCWREKDIIVENNILKVNVKKHSAEVFILH